MYFTQILMEAIMIGVGFTIFGMIITKLYLKYVKKTMNNVCRDIFNNESLIQVLFISGFLFHIFCEITMINKWYCKNGHACI